MSRTVSIECNELVLTNNTEQEGIVIKTSPGKTLSTDRHFCDIIFKGASGIEQTIPSSNSFSLGAPAVNLWAHGKTSTRPQNSYKFNEIEPDVDGVITIKRSGIYSINSTIIYKYPIGGYNAGYFGIATRIKIPDVTAFYLVGTQVVDSTQSINNTIFLSTSFTGYLIAGSNVRIVTSQTTGTDLYLSTTGSGVFNLNITELLV